MVALSALALGLEALQRQKLSLTPLQQRQLTGQSRGLCEVRTALQGRGLLADPGTGQEDMLLLVSTSNSHFVAG